MLIGRDHESVVLSNALVAARDGRSSALVISGEAGIGKSALLGEARHLSGSGRILSTVGIEGESAVRTCPVGYGWPIPIRSWTARL
ncbi:MAG: AAA family ATPase [Propionibacteriaceae bacterium]